MVRKSRDRFYVIDVAGEGLVRYDGANGKETVRIPRRDSCMLWRWKGRGAMRSLIALYLMAGMMLAGLQPLVSPPAGNNTPYSTDGPVALTEERYQRSDPGAEADISIEYVQISRLHDPMAQEAANERLRREAFSDWQPDKEEGIALAIVQTPVLFRNYLSVTTWTSCDISGVGHPWCSLDSLVIDLNTGDLVELGDLLEVDDGRRIREMIGQGAFKNDRFSHEECLNMEWYDRLGDSIVGEEDRTGGFYLTEDGMVFLIDVSHVEGDYLIFEIGYDELEGLCRID